MKALQVGARILSFVFHPLGVLTYTLLFLLWSNPYVFGVNRALDRWELILTVTVTTVVIPGIAVIMMRLLNMVEDIRLRDRMQRIGPYIAAGIFYVWLSKNLLENMDIPFVFAAISIGSTLSIFICFVINVQFKISIHAVGAAGMIANFIILYLYYPYAKIMLFFPVWGALKIGMMTMVFLAVILAGAMGTARLILGMHRPQEVYWGYFAGFIAPFLGLHVANILQ